MERPFLKPKIVMKGLTPLFFSQYIIIVSLSCGGPTTAERMRAEEERVEQAQRASTEAVNRMVREREEKATRDSVAIANAPIQITKSRIVERSHSKYRDISLTFKNTSGKTIKAARFKWEGLNAFGEPADMGLTKGSGRGWMDKTLRPGQTLTLQWDVLSSDLSTLKNVLPYEVVFEDGATWEL